MGRFPDRSHKAIGQEALLVWVCIKLPFTEDQLHFLDRAFQYERGNHKKFTYADRQKYYYQPLSFDEDTPKEADKTDKGDKYSSFFDALFGKSDDERHGGRYGYGVSLPKKAKKQAELVDPEWVDADDQDAIDAVASDLLDSIDWGTK